MPNLGAHTPGGTEVSPRRLSLATVVGGVLGILWLVASMFAVGLGVFLSGAARDVDSGLAWFCLGLGILTWVLGLALVALYLMALVRRHYLSALLVVVTPLVAGTVVIVGPTNAADFWGPVPTPAVAAVATGIVLAAATGVAFRVRSAAGRDPLPARGGTTRMPSAIAAMAIGAAGLVVTVSVLWMGLIGSGGWIRERPWGVVAWVPVLAGIWFLVYRLWRRSGTPRTGSRDQL